MPAFQVLWPRWRQLTSTAAHRGVLCFGHDRGRNVTYTNPHRWLPGFGPRTATTALRTLVRAYLHAYGPATPQHFAKWLNVPPRRAVELFEAAGGRAGARRARRRRRRGSSPATPTAPETRVAGIRLLPYFDAYVVAAQPRELLYPGAAATPARSPRRARPATTRSCSSTASSAACGTSGARAGGSRSRSSRCAPLSAAQRRELDEEVALVGTRHGGRCRRWSSAR